MKTYTYTEEEIRKVLEIYLAEWLVDDLLAEMATNRDHAENPEAE